MARKQAEKGYHRGLSHPFMYGHQHFKFICQYTRVHTVTVHSNWLNIVILCVQRLHATQGGVEVLLILCTIQIETVGPSTTVMGGDCWELWALFVMAPAYAGNKTQVKHGASGGQQGSFWNFHAKTSRGHYLCLY